MQKQASIPNNTFLLTGRLDIFIARLLSGKHEFIELTELVEVATRITSEYLSEEPPPLPPYKFNEVWLVGGLGRLQLMLYHHFTVTPQRQRALWPLIRRVRLLLVVMWMRNNPPFTEYAKGLSVTDPPDSSGDDGDFNEFVEGLRPAYSDPLVCADFVRQTLLVMKSQVDAMAL